MSRFLQPDKPTEEIGYKLSDFFLKESNNDYTKAQEEVQKVGIVNLSFVPGNNGNKGTLTIYTARPGMLIGRKGNRINALAEFLKPFNVENINIQEAYDWTSALVPVDYLKELEDEMETESYSQSDMMEDDDRYSPHPLSNDFD